jgi:hypothetical protein
MRASCPARPNRLIRFCWRACSALGGRATLVWLFHRCDKTDHHGHGAHGWPGVVWRGAMVGPMVRHAAVGEGKALLAAIGRSRISIMGVQT